MKPTRCIYHVLFTYSYCSVCCSNQFSCDACSADDKEAINRRKLVSKWHPTTKGTLKRSYRVPSKAEGRRLLKSIAGLLSDDDHFVDATSHKVSKKPLAYHK